jgi:hypothetical protein
MQIAKLKLIPVQSGALTVRFPADSRGNRTHKSPQKTNHMASHATSDSKTALHSTAVPFRFDFRIGRSVQRASMVTMANKTAAINYAPTTDVRQEHHSQPTKRPRFRCRKK